MRVLLPEARERFAAAGASVDSSSEMVRLDRGLVSLALSSAPALIEMRAPDPGRNVTIGGRHLAVTPVSGPPYASDLDRGRRPGTLRDFHELLMLSQSFDVIHLLGPLIEPQDVLPPFRHLEVTLAQLTLSDKIPFVYSRGRPQIEDCFTMIRMAHGLSEDEFRDRAYCYTNINTNSPRQLDIPMAQGILDFAAAGQLLIVTPFTWRGRRLCSGRACTRRAACARARVARRPCPTDRHNPPGMRRRTPATLRRCGTSAVSAPRLRLSSAADCARSRTRTRPEFAGLGQSDSRSVRRAPQTHFTA